MSSFDLRVALGVGDAMRDLGVPAIKLVVAAALGGVIGMTRERVRDVAGFRTHMIVAIAAAGITAVATSNAFDQNGLSRVVQGILQGVGFLGAGTILQRSRRDDESNGHSAGHEGVRGLTTAASVWLVAVIGTAVGVGAIGVALLATMLGWIVLVPLKQFEDLAKRKAAAIDVGGRGQRKHDSQ